MAMVVLSAGVATPLAGQTKTPVRAERKRPKCEATSAERHRDLHGATLSDALQGRMPGVTVTQTGGAASAGRVRIRGSNSLRSGGPLIFLDGIRIISSRWAGYREMHSVPLFEFINPTDIDRIEVLRGAAATIQYGMDASDGVIRIFTRRGGAEPDSVAPAPDCVPGNG